MLDARHRQRSSRHQIHVALPRQLTRQERHERRLTARLEF
jgi:hypothetical protein